MPIFRKLLRVPLLACSLLLLSALPAPVSLVGAQSTPSGRILGSARGQVAWLDLLAPRPTPLTQLVRPAYPADVAGAPGLSFAVASVVGAYRAGGGGLGADLMRIDLESGAATTLLSRKTDSESLDMPAVWPDGSGILYQRSHLNMLSASTGQAQPQYVSRIEQVDSDGQGPVALVDNARYPAPAPDGSRFAYVRSTDHGSGIFIHSVADGSDADLVPLGQFVAVAYPRFSPDGQHVAFAGITRLVPIVMRPDPLSWFRIPSALAHGFPWETWLVNSDGSGLHEIQGVLDDDPSIAWSPDARQLLIYGGWGSFLVEVSSGAATPLPYLAGYGSVAWLD